MNFLDRFSKNTRILHFPKIRPLELELMLRTDGRTDMTNLIVTFCGFANAPSKLKLYKLFLQ